MGDGDQNGGDQNGLEELNRAEQSWSGSKNQNTQNISKLKKYQENVND